MAQVPGSERLGTFRDRSLVPCALRDVSAQARQYRRSCSALVDPHDQNLDERGPGRPCVQPNRHYLFFTAFCVQVHSAESLYLSNYVPVYYRSCCSNESVYENQILGLREYSLGIPSQGPGHQVQRGGVVLDSLPQHNKVGGSLLATYFQRANCARSSRVARCERDMAPSYQ